MAYIERPDLEEDGLSQTCGYVTQIGVEQENDRDALWFHLDIYVEIGASKPSVFDNVFCIYLDVGTTVALAQLHLLRDAMLNNLLVYIHYLDDSEDTGINFVYRVRVYGDMPFPTTVNSLRAAGEFM